MRPHDVQRIASLLTDYYGLPLEGTLGISSDGQEYFDLTPEGIPSQSSFRVRLTIGWRSLKGEFIPGSFSGAIIEEMGKASQPDRNTFTGLLRKMSDDRGTVTMSVNGEPADPFDSSIWPTEWERLFLTFEKSPLPINTENQEKTTESLLRWAGRFTAAVIALAPLEALETQQNINPDGLPEGAKIRIEVNRYERSAFNRATCIELHGYICKACGFDFSEVYGDLGKDFIHVHHVTPVSEVGDGYVIDPANDLVPLCPNCHAMVHRRKPPLTVTELKAKLVCPVEE